MLYRQESQLLRLYVSARFATGRRRESWFDNLAANGKIEMAWQETFGRMASAKSPINLAYRG